MMCFIHFVCYVRDKRFFCVGTILIIRNIKYNIVTGGNMNILKRALIYLKANIGKSIVLSVIAFISMLALSSMVIIDLGKVSK